jgi:hypothetical protein
MTGSVVVARPFVARHRSISTCLRCYATWAIVENFVIQVVQCPEPPADRQACESDRH